MDEKPVCYNVASMFDLLWLCVGAFLRLFRNRQNLLLENLALRQQLTVLKRKHRKPRLALLDRLCSAETSYSIRRHTFPGGIHDANRPKCPQL
jgi:hypothetical protein